MQISSTPTPTTGQPYSQAKSDLEQAAKQFEAIFMRQMIGAMRSASLDEGIGDSSATLQFRDMMDANVADNMSETGAFGFAKLLVKQFENRVAGAQPATTGAAAAPKTDEDAK
jgi:flagellar protein FlgJ